MSLQILVNSVNPTRPAALYEKVTVSEGGSPLLRDMLFSPDMQYIYTLTDRQVSSSCAAASGYPMLTKPVPGSQSYESLATVMMAVCMWPSLTCITNPALTEGVGITMPC